MTKIAAIKPEASDENEIDKILSYMLKNVTRLPSFLNEDRPMVALVVYL